MTVNGIFTTFEDFNDNTLTPQKLHIETRISTRFLTHFFSTIKEDKNYDK